MYTQDLFWKNIPSESKTVSSHLGFLKWKLINTSFLKDLEIPFYIWTGTNYIRKLENKKFSKKLINKINKKGLHIYLYEPICWKTNENHNRSFYSEFLDNVDLNLIRSDELDSIEKFVSNNNLKNVKVYTCDYQIEKIKNNYPTLNLYCLDIFLRFIKYESDFLKFERTIDKKFWCGNWRYTGHRHIVASYVSNYDSILSWNHSCNINNLKKLNWFNFDNLDIDVKLKIEKGAEYLEKDVKSIDHNIEALKIKNIEDVYIPNLTAPRRTFDLIKSYRQCFCAVVNETRFAQPFGNLSEKVIHAMNAGLPVVLVAPPRSLEYLRKLGFKTFNDFWDESYDLEENHQQRLLKIFKVIDYINSKSLDELKILHSEMKNILDHNILTIMTLQNNSQPS